MKDMYHVIGFPLKHTLSPYIQMKLSKKYKQNMLFTAFEIQPKLLEKMIKEFKNNHQIKGLSITTPYKEKIFMLSDKHDDNAKNVKSVSNVIFTNKREMIALNYDGIGFIYDIKNNYKINFTNKKILIIGAGGVTKSIIYEIIKELPLSISITNRTKFKAKDIKYFFKDYSINVINFNNINDSFDIVINATSSSMYNKLLPLNKSNFNKNSFAYDLMYGNNGTIFTKWCKSCNIMSADGIGMLNEVNFAAFKRWRKL